MGATPLKAAQCAAPLARCECEHGLPSWERIISADACKDLDLRSLGRKFKNSSNVQTELSEMEAADPLEPRGVDFEAMRAIPPGWTRSPEAVPKGFLCCGLDGCVIVRDGEKHELVDELSSPRLSARSKESVSGRLKRVLVAFPDWAVDTQKAGFFSVALWRPELNKLCHVRRVQSAPNFNTTVVEFDWPCGEELTRFIDRTEDGVLSSQSGVTLCRDLIQVLLQLESMGMTMWGMLHPSSVFVGGDGGVATLLPLGCLLSYRGALSAACSIVVKHGQAGVPPELIQEVNKAEGYLLKNPEACFAADTYAAARVILEALVGSDRVQDFASGTQQQGQPPLTAILGPMATDFLAKALYKDLRFRIRCEDAAAHPWLRPASSRAPICQVRSW